MYARDFNSAGLQDAGLGWWSLCLERALHVGVAPHHSPPPSSPTTTRQACRSTRPRGASARLDSSFIHSCARTMVSSVTAFWHERKRLLMWPAAELVRSIPTFMAE